MDPERFKQLGLNPVRWVYKAHRLYIAAQALAGPEAHALVSAFSRGAIGSHLTLEELEHIQRLGAYTDAGNLLYGLSIENAYKARQIKDGKISVEAGIFKGVRTDHNILEMVKASGISLDDSDIDHLRSITFAVRSMGKYPIAKSAEQQRYFTGRTCGSDISAPLTRRVVVFLLRDAAYVDIFLKGTLSGIDDTG